MGTNVYMRHVYGVDMGDAYVNNELFVDEEYGDDLEEGFGFDFDMFEIETYGNDHWKHPVIVIKRSLKPSGSEVEPIKVDTLFLPTKHELAALEKLCKKLNVPYIPRNLIIAMN